MVYGLALERVYEIPAMLNGSIAGTFEKLPQFLVFFFLAAVAVIVGFWGLRLMKVISSVSCAVIGYFAGNSLFFVLAEKIPAMSSLPEWLHYVSGGVLAVLLLLVGLKRSTYALTTLAALAGFYFVYTLLSPLPALVVTGGLLLALLVALCMKYSLIVIFSVIGGFLGVNFVSVALPDVALIQLVPGNKTVLLIAASVSLLFMVIQLISTRKYRFK